MFQHHFAPRIAAPLLMQKGWPKLSFLFFVILKQSIFDLDMPSIREKGKSPFEGKIFHLLYACVPQIMSVRQRAEIPGTQRNTAISPTFTAL